VPSHLTVEELIQEAKCLPEPDQKRLVHALLMQPEQGQHEITELRGLGKEIWQNQDAQEYVDQERAAWED